MAGQRRFDLAVSLVPACRTKHQSLRVRARFDEARERHDYLAGKTLLLRGRSRLLLALGTPLSRRACLRLWPLIRWHFPLLRFTLLIGPEGDTTGEQWQGDDAVWDRHLAPFRPTGNTAGGAA